jgi:hypothetical protein
VADIGITEKDVDDVRQALAACETMLTAHGMMEAQIRLQPYRAPALALEVERLRHRFDMYMADHVLQERDASREGTEEAEEGQEDEEALSGSPLGEPALPRQEGRRLSAEELKPAPPGVDPEEAIRSDLGTPMHQVEIDGAERERGRSG